MVGFRGCDGNFGGGLQSIRENPGEFGMLVNTLVNASKKRDEEIKINAEVFLEKYGIKYCPFHSGALVKDVIPKDAEREFSINDLGIGNDIYTFDTAVCSLWKYCETPVSFDEGLIKSLHDNIILELELGKNNGCTTCGDPNGNIYLVGFRSPRKNEAAIRNDREFSNDKPVYLFDRPSCGHNYVTLGSGGAPGPQKKGEEISGRIRLSY